MSVDDSNRSRGDSPTTEDRHVAWKVPPPRSTSSSLAVRSRSPSRDTPRSDQLLRFHEAPAALGRSCQSPSRAAAGCRLVAVALQHRAQTGHRRSPLPLGDASGDLPGAGSIAMPRVETVTRAPGRARHRRRVQSPSHGLPAEASHQTPHVARGLGLDLPQGSSDSHIFQKPDAGIDSSRRGRARPHDRA